MKVEKKASVGKIAFWYTFSNFLGNGITFLITPFFTRMLSKTEYGLYGNYTAWFSLLTVITTMNLYASVSRAKYDFDDDIDGFLSSILAASATITIVLYLFIEINSVFFISFFDMDIKYIRLLFLTLLFDPALAFLQKKERLYQRYKVSVGLFILSVVSKSVVSIFLVVIMNDKLQGRILGDVIPCIAINLVLYVMIMIRGKKISLKYIRYGLAYSVPLVPHMLAGNILITSDRIMIKRFCGAEQAAMYTIAYTCSVIVNILWTSMNQAWGPWVYDRLAYGESDKIRLNSKLYFGIFIICTVGIMLVMPEIVQILGGKNYYETRYVIPPLCAGFVCQFVYSMYVNLEYFNKKTIAISCATFLAAGLNVALNFIFIPYMGYEVAAYTSFIGYALMVFFHYFIVKKILKMDKIFDNVFNFGIILLTMLFIPLCRWLYNYLLIRYMVLAFIFGLTGALIWRYKKEIRALIGNQEVN